MFSVLYCKQIRKYFGHNFMVGIFSGHNKAGLISNFSIISNFNIWIIYIQVTNFLNKMS